MLKMPRSVPSIVPVVALALLCGACAFPAGRPAQKNAARDAVGMFADGIAEDAPAPEARADAALYATAAKPAASPEPAAPTDRKIIHTGSLVLRVADAEVAGRQSRELAAELGGYLQEESTGGVIFRIPAGRFREAFARLAELGTIESRRVVADDVTEDYLDVELRLRMKTKFLTELEALYARGGQLKDLLQIKREIDKITEEIERLKGRLRYLKDRIALATLTVRFNVVRSSVGHRFALPFQWVRELGVDRLLK